MKVIYMKSVIEKIAEAVQSAKKAGKEIERIEITHSEWEELGRFVYLGAPYSPHQFNMIRKTGPIILFGVNIVLEGGQYEKR